MEHSKTISSRHLQAKDELVITPYEPVWGKEPIRIVASSNIVVKVQKGRILIYPDFSSRESAHCNFSILGEEVV